MLDLLRRDPRSRIFFVAHAQSSIGTGAAYVGLLLIAYERLRSPWAITLVLLADFLPAMLLGPLFGAAADRWSRRWCAVASDLARGGAFIAIALVGSFELTVLFALIAGAGSGLFTPAVLAGLPSLVAQPRLPAATSLYGAIADLGHTVGPALAAAVLIFTTPETLMIANGATFAISALLLARLQFGEPPAGSADERQSRPSLLAEARSGLRATAEMQGVRTLILASSAVILFAGMLNVGELLLVQGELGAGESAFSALVAVFGVGVIAGSLAGSRADTPAKQKRNYLLGLLGVAVGLVASGLAPSYGVAIATFGLTGVGNGLVLVHERLLMQRTVPDGLMGRVFGVRDGLGAWGFGLAFAGAGAILALIGTRPLFLVAGAGALVVWAVSALALRGTWNQRVPAAAPAPVTGEPLASPFPGGLASQTAGAVSSGRGAPVEPRPPAKPAPDRFIRMTDDAPQSTPAPRSQDGWRRLIPWGLAVLALGLAAGVGGYGLGRTSGHDLEAAKLAGARAGEETGTSVATEQGFKVGLREGRIDGYRRAIRRAEPPAADGATPAPPVAPDLSAPEGPPTADQPAPQPEALEPAAPSSGDEG